MSPDLTHHPKQAKKIDVLLDLYQRKSVEVEAEGFKQLPGEQKFRQKNKKTVFLGLLNVALPTFDVYSDLAVSIHFFRGSKKTRQHTTMQNSGLA